MTSLKTKKKVTKTKADLEMISAQENLLIDKEKRITMKFKQEFSQISIDINIAKSKIESLENLQQMNIG